MLQYYLSALVLMIAFPTPDASPKRQGYLAHRLRTIAVTLDNAARAAPNKHSQSQANAKMIRKKLDLMLQKDSSEQITRSRSTQQKKMIRIKKEEIILRSHNNSVRKGISLLKYHTIDSPDEVKRQITRSRKTLKTQGMKIPPRNKSPKYFSNLGIDDSSLNYEMMAVFHKRSPPALLLPKLSSPKKKLQSLKANRFHTQEIKHMVQKSIFCDVEPWEKQSFQQQDNHLIDF